MERFLRKYQLTFLVLFSLIFNSFALPSFLDNVAPGRNEFQFPSPGREDAEVQGGAALGVDGLGEKSFHFDKEFSKGPPPPPTTFRTTTTTRRPRPPTTCAPCPVCPIVPSPPPPYYPPYQTPPYGQTPPPNQPNYGQSPPPQQPNYGQPPPQQQPHFQPPPNRPFPRGAEESVSHHNLTNHVNKTGSHNTTKREAGDWGEPESQLDSTGNELNQTAEVSPAEDFKNWVYRSALESTSTKNGTNQTAKVSQAGDFKNWVYRAAPDSTGNELNQIAEDSQSGDFDDWGYRSAPDSTGNEVNKTAEGFKNLTSESVHTKSNETKHKALQIDPKNEELKNLNLRSAVENNTSHTHEHDSVHTNLINTTSSGNATHNATGNATHNGTESEAERKMNPKFSLWNKMSKMF